MSTRYPAGIIRPGYAALKVPNPPTIGTATSTGANSVSVTVTAPSDVGGGAISSFTAFTSCGAYSGSNTTSPVTVTGLTTDTSYTFKVIATNAYGPGLPSGLSNSATPALPVGQVLYCAPGTYSWVAPSGVTAVSVIAVGGGGGIMGGQGQGGAGGGGLGYKNNISVTPGVSYTLVVGAYSGYCGNSARNAGASYFCSASVVRGGGGVGIYGGAQGGSGGTYTGDGGGNGGNGGCGGANVACSGSTKSGGGGGAGGYSGTGGAGGFGLNGGAAATAGSGGGGGGGGASYSSSRGAGGGGGVGIGGTGSNGTAGSPNAGTGYGTGGGGGSCGSAGQQPGNDTLGGTGGQSYGGGGGGGASNGSTGGGSVVRIIWPGSTRSFPSTSVGDL